MPSDTLEEYLETIYKLAQKGPVRPTQIAESIGVSGPTVTATLRRLEALELAERSSDGGVLLTKEGLRTALDIVRRHRIAERFLVDVLGLDVSEAHEDACLLEHALSPRVLAALEEYLDSPQVCPHGHPIPSSDGSIASVQGTPLCDLERGERGVVLQIDEDDDAVLSYLAELGLLPGVQVVVLETAPFGGPLVVEVGDTRPALAREIAALVLVDVGNPVSEVGSGV